MAMLYTELFGFSGEYALAENRRVRRQSEQLRVWSRLTRAESEQLRARTERLRARTSSLVLTYCGDRLLHFSGSSDTADQNRVSRLDRKSTRLNSSHLGIS